MRATLHVALDLLHEATYRRWILGMLGTITFVVLMLGFSLQLELVDGVIAGTRFFGDDLDHTVRTAESLLRPLLIGLSWAVYVAGLGFGTLACSSFAPELLAPGRIEHLLSLPVRRSQLIFGTYLGVLAIALISALYAGGALTLLIGIKAQVWSLAPLAAGLSACVGFTAVYGAMLAAATMVRNAGVSAGVGGVVMILGALLPRPELAATFDPGWSRDVYCASVSWLPRLSSLGNLSLWISGLDKDTTGLLAAAAAAPVFGMACVAVAIWELERRDF